MKFPLQLYDLGAQYGQGAAVYKVLDASGQPIATSSTPLSVGDMREVLRRANAYDRLTALLREIREDCYTEGDVANKISVVLGETR